MEGNWKAMRDREVEGRSIKQKNKWKERRKKKKLKSNRNRYKLNRT